MKKILLMTILSAVICSVGCKKQDVKRDSINDDSKLPKASVDEPSLRAGSYSDVNLKTVYFDFDRSNLTAGSLEKLKKNAIYLIKNRKLNVVVEGNTDNRGTTEYNLSLGQRRASKVKEYYVQLGVPAGRIATISYGKENPVDTADNESAWAKNRRAETKILER